MTIEELKQAYEPEGVYAGMTQAEALRYLAKRYLRKAECIALCNGAADYIEALTADTTGWRDISTAPYDEIVLFYTHDGNIVQDFMYDCGPNQMGVAYTHWQPLLPPPGEEPLDRLQRLGQECDAADRTIESLKGSLEVMRQGVARRDEDIEELIEQRDALQARCDKLEAAAREACEQLKSLAYASHKATGRPLSKRPRTKLLQRPEKVRDNLLAVRKVLRSVVDGGE